MVTMNFTERTSLEGVVNKIIADGVKFYENRLFTECAKNYRMYLLLGSIGCRREVLFGFIEDEFVLKELNGYEKLKYPSDLNVESLVIKARNDVKGNIDNEIRAIKEVLEHFYESKAGAFLRDNLIFSNKREKFPSFTIVSSGNEGQVKDESVMNLALMESCVGLQNDNKGENDMGHFNNNIENLKSGKEVLIANVNELNGDEIIKEETNFNETINETINEVMNEETNVNETINEEINVNETINEVMNEETNEEEKVLKITKVSKEGFCGICVSKILDKSQTCLIDFEGEEHEVHVNCAVEFKSDFKTSDGLNKEMLDNFIEEQLPLGKTYGTAQRALSALRRYIKKQEKGQEESSSVIVNSDDNKGQEESSNVGVNSDVIINSYADKGQEESSNVIVNSNIDNGQDVLVNS